MNNKLENKVVAITGGNTGIGLESAKVFAAQGAKVAILARSQEKLDAALAEIGDSAIGFIGDVRDLPSLEAFFACVEKRIGKVDVLFANAGLSTPAPLEETDEALFDLHSDVNFKGAFFTVKSALPHLNQGASVVLTSSCLDEMGVTGLSVYSATKAAVRSLARSFTPELKKYGARINVLSPGPVITDIEKKAGASEEEISGFRSMFAERLPAGRMGQVHEMASVALFLASDDSSFMYGAEVQADGGMNQTRWLN
ncbi:NAD(P)-dependent dehydrogenase, short-chain alcohol dehydrogenase family [Ferrimonas sediminum]|uniref:NAD(P)-dependent dehydrogenase, short-chain alcohol dehydrogenase family n=1 Tax=Ferrimonas sediminum TaxID=718193 RepID=A0A1G8RJX3_9GAMM|nr:SDR family oxidoreductase [Ferrimonas sediminum]SDJ17278.1 NAD(P)-dependent dehydrogenase, short-chain alcohol dehydrogenase family [Ferrimonas sediminum]